MKTLMGRRARLALAGCFATGLAAAPFGAAQAAGINQTGAISKFSGVDGIEFACTSATSFVAMRDMKRTFTLGGPGASSVVVMFQGALSFGSTQNDTGFIRLTIDNKVQGPGDQVPVIGNEDVSSGSVREDGGHGFNWQTKSLTPGNHTARILWRSDQGSNFCVDARSLVVLHK